MKTKDWWGPADGYLQEHTEMQPMNNSHATPYAQPCIFPFFQYWCLQHPLCTSPAHFTFQYTKYTVYNTYCQHMSRGQLLILPIFLKDVGPHVHLLLEKNFKKGFRTDQIIHFIFSCAPSLLKKLAQGVLGLRGVTAR